MTEVTADPEVLLAQFNRLVQELLRGTVSRNCFQPWEIELLLDIEACHLRDANKRETLRRYQKAVQRLMEKGAQAPMKLSAFLDANRLRKEQLQVARAAAAAQAVAG